MSSASRRCSRASAREPARRRAAPSSASARACSSAACVASSVSTASRSAGHLAARHERVARAARARARARVSACRASATSSAASATASSERPSACSDIAASERHGTTAGERTSMRPSRAPPSRASASASMIRPPSRRRRAAHDQQHRDAVRRAVADLAGSHDPLLGLLELAALHQAEREHRQREGPVEAVRPAEDVERLARVVLGVARARRAGTASSARPQAAAAKRGAEPRRRASSIAAS